MMELGSTFPAWHSASDRCSLTFRQVTNDFGSCYRIRTSPAVRLWKRYAPFPTSFIRLFWTVLGWWLPCAGILTDYRRRTSLKIYFEEPSNLSPLSPEVERALFRIAQESINNVLRHSGASAVIVTLLNRGKTVTLEINDNGTGLNPDELTRLDGVASLGVGIAGMRERVRQLKGTFKINSMANGTQVSVSLPIDQEQHAAHIVSR